MKLNYLLLALALPSLALAEEAAPPSFSATEFLTGYMQCDQAEENAKKDPATLTCNQIVNAHFCSIFTPLPADVKENIALELTCNFLAQGMQAGDTLDEGDIVSLRDTGCLTGDKTRRKLKQKYGGKKITDEADALENFTKAYLRNEARCGTGDDK